METRVCSECGVEKDITQFPIRNQNRWWRQTYCLECRSKLGASWYERNKEYQKQNAKKHRTEASALAREFILNYLLTHPCIHCGESNPIVLEFHHRYGKDMTVAQMVSSGYAIPKIQAEIDKCDVLCANCHRIVTAKERGWYRVKS